MSEIKKYKKYLNFKANPRYLTRDFIVPLYTGTEPDILDDSNTQRESSVYKEFPNDMPIVSPKEIQNQPYEQLQLADGGSVERRGFSASLVTDYIKKKKDKTVTTGELLTLLENNKVKDPSGALFRILNNPSFIQQGFNVVKTGIREEKKYRPQSSLSKSELNKASQYFFNKDYNDLTDQAQRDKITQRVRQGEGIFKKKTMYDQFSKTDQQKILKEFPDAVFKEEQSYGFKPTHPQYKTVYNFVNRGFKIRNFKPLPKPVQNDIKANFSEVLEKDWNFKLNKYGIPLGGKTRNVAMRILNFVTDPSEKKFRYNFRFGSPDGWMLAQMDRAYLNGDENYKPLYQNKKIVGFQDNTAKGGGKKYYHIKYKGPLDENKVLVNNHPDYKKVSKFVDVAKNAKTNIPEALAKLLPEGYDTNKLKFNDFLNFMLDNKKTDIKTLRNAIEIHHAKGLSSPTSDLQLLTRTANVLARDVEQQILKGDLSNVNKLKEEGIRLVVEGKSYGAGKETAEKGVSRIQQQVIDHFKNNPEKLTEFISTLGCSQKINALGLGGRVKFSNGSSCYMKGLEKIQSGELGNAEKRIAGEFLQAAGAASEDVQDVFKGTKIGLRFLQDVVVGLTRPVIAANVGISAAAEGENLLRGQLNPVSRVVESVTFGALGGGPTEVADQMLEFGSPGTIKTINHSKTIKKFNDQIESEKNDIENANYTYAEYGIDPTNVILEKEKNIANIEKQKNEFLSNPTFVLTQKDKNDFENDFKKIVRIGLDKGIEGTKKTARFTPEIQATSNEILIDRERFPNFASQLATNLKGTEIENILKPYSDIEKSIIDESTFIAKDPGLLEIKNYYQDFKNAGDIIYNKSEPLTDEQRIGIEEMGARGGAAEGGRIGLSGGGGPKMGRRGFLGLIAGAAAAPDLIKSIKGTGQAGKIASKIKIEPAEGMYPWFPKLVEKIKDMGKPFEEKQLIMEPSYKNDPRPFGSRQPTGEEKLTKHVDGDTTFILREYPDGRLAVDIDSPRNQQSFGQPVSLYYRPKMEFQNYKGEKKIEPPEFKVLEPEPRPFVTGPDDVDITFTEIPKNPKRNTVFGDIEAAERFATGNIKNRKIIPVKQSLRNEMEEDPSTFIMRESGELGSKARPEEIIKKTEEFATGGRVGFGDGSKDPNKLIPIDPLLQDQSPTDPGRRDVLKLGIAGAGVLGLGKLGLLKLGSSVKPSVFAEAVKGTTAPSWMDSLMTKIIKEGTEIKMPKESGIIKKEVQFKNPETGDVQTATLTIDSKEDRMFIEYDSPTNVANQPVVLELSRERKVVPNPGGESNWFAPDKTKGYNFYATETGPRVTDWDGNIEFDAEDTAFKIIELKSDISGLKSYATGGKGIDKKIAKEKRAATADIEKNPEEYVPDWEPEIYD
jgi:hypothetical protein